MARATDLLGRIEEGALDPRRPLADTLRLCVALGGRAGSPDLRDWARKELDGYGADDDLPDYRVVTVPILIDGSNFHAIITGQQLAPSDVPDFAREEISGELGLRMAWRQWSRWLASPTDPSCSTQGWQTSSTT